MGFTEVPEKGRPAMKHRIALILLLLSAAVPLYAASEITPFGGSNDETAQKTPPQNSAGDVPERKTPPVINEDSRFIVTFGIENMSRSAAVKGGSYIYSGFMAGLTDDIYLNAKCSASIVPYWNDDVPLFLGMTFRILHWGDNMGILFSPLYMISPHSFSKAGFTDADNSVGGRLCLISQADAQQHVFVELLPFTLYYDVTAKDYSWSIEFISVGYIF